MRKKSGLNGYFGEMFHERRKSMGVIISARIERRDRCTSLCSFCYKTKAYKVYYKVPGNKNEYNSCEFCFSEMIEENPRFTVIWQTPSALAKGSTRQLASALDTPQRVWYNIPK